MSTPRGFGINGFKYFTNVCKPIDVNINFTVDSTNGNGLGIRTLKSNGFVENVFMNTSATPGIGSGGFVNPNPAVGFAQITFRNNFNYYLGGFSGVIAPLASSGLTSVTLGSVYVITTLGTTTLAQWLAAGLNPGLLPTVGQSFVAKETGALGGTGTVGAPGVSTTTGISVVGDPNQAIKNSAIAVNAGAQVIIQFSAGSAIAAPANNSVVGMCFRFDGSSVTVDGL
jgi:hypothetical protein